MDETLPNSDLTLADRVTDILARQIRGGAYPVNSRLPTEKFMTQEYGVSRTVIREAISRLKSEGLVDTRQGSGTVVLDPKRSRVFRLGSSDDDPGLGVIRIIELRRGIEVEMAALAAERRTVQQMEQINRAVKAIDEAERGGGDGVEEDLTFHLAIAHATGNPHYPALLGMLTEALRDAIRVTRGNEARQKQLADKVRSEHEAIRSAIEQRDVAMARHAAYSHMQNTSKRIETVDPAYWKGPSRALAQRLVKTKLTR